MGDPKLQRLERAVHARDWDAVISAVRNDPTQWLVPSVLVSDEAAIETETFRRLADARPGPLSTSLVGAAMARDAWAMIGADETVEDIGAERHTDFETAMVAAEQTLIEAINGQPSRPDAWVYLLSTGRGLRVGLTELRRRFEQVHLVDPFRPDAVRAYLHGLSYRGGGNDATMFEFARWVRDEAPPGSAAQVALPAAHLEYGLGSCPTTLTEHLVQASTVDEIARSLSGFLEASPDRAGPTQLGPLNAFALAITVEDQRTAKLMRDTFRRIDGRPTAYPWTLYREDISGVFTEVQRTQLRSAARFLP
ncbi:MAG: hypothetical protein ACK5PP_00820 [Acidimicrobiales bacterium]